MEYLMHCDTYKGIRGVTHLKDTGFIEIGKCISSLAGVKDKLIVGYVVNDLAFLIVMWENLPFYNFVVMESRTPKNSFLSYVIELDCLYKEVFTTMENLRRYRWYMSRKDNLLPERLSSFWKKLPAFSRYDTYIEDVSCKESGYEFSAHNNLTNLNRTKKDNFTLVSGSLKQEHRVFQRDTFV
jgi:hypothetical protein